MYDILIFYAIAAFLIINSQFFFFHFLFVIKNKNRFYKSLTTYWVTFVVNIVYTGLLGWNWTPVTTLESALDIVATLIMMLAVLGMCIACDPHPKVDKFLNKIISIKRGK